MHRQVSYKEAPTMVGSVYTRQALSPLALQELTVGEVLTATSIHTIKKEKVIAIDYDNNTITFEVVSTERNPEYIDKR